MPALVDALELARRDRVPVLCQCPCCAATISLGARLIDEIALEQAEVVRSRIAGLATRLREAGVVLRSVDIPRSERVELFSGFGSN